MGTPVCTVEGEANLTACLAHNGEEHQLALINKDAAPVKVQLDGALAAHRAGHAMCLSGPGLDAKDGVALAQVKAPSGSTFSIRGYTALLLRWPADPESRLNACAKVELAEFAQLLLNKWRMAMTLLQKTIRPEIRN